MSDKRLADIRVLHVDDDADAREVVQCLLSDEGATVLSRDCAADAYRDVLDFQPHVLVLDMALPVEDGVSLMRRIRSLYGDATPPAIAVTAWGLVYRDTAMAAGFDAFLPKPLQHEMLVLLVATLAPPGMPGTGSAEPC